MNKAEAQKRLQDAGLDRRQAAMILATIELALGEFKTERLKLFIKVGSIDAQTRPDREALDASNPTNVLYRAHGRTLAHGRLLMKH